MTQPRRRTRVRATAGTSVAVAPPTDHASRCRRKRALLDQLRTTSDPSYRTEVQTELDLLADVPILSYHELRRL